MLEDCLFLISFGLAPEAGMGRADLPLGMATWLLPVQAAMQQIRSETT